MLHNAITVINVALTSVDLRQQSSAPPTKLTSEKLRLSSGGNEDDHGEGTVSDSDLDDIFGISDSSALEVIQQFCVCSKIQRSWLCLDFSNALNLYLVGKGSP